MIVEAFGGGLEKMPEKKAGIIDISVMRPDPLFAGKSILRVYENHSWRIKTLPPDFEVLAASDHAIEAIRHKTKSIYGFQFHPEQFVDQTDGDEVFLRIFYKIAAMR